MPTTSFDRRFDAWMHDQEFAESYRLHRARIDAIDNLMRAIDEERERQHLTKAELAAIRRLFSQRSPNPQIGRLVDMANELGLEVVVRRRPRHHRNREAAPAAS
jgi:hypothetical protein